MSEDDPLKRARLAREIALAKKAHADMERAQLALERQRGDAKPAQAPVAPPTPPLPAWAPMAVAATRIGKAERTVRRWRAKAPSSLFDPPKGKVRRVDVEGLRAWADSMGLLGLAPSGGRRSAIDALTAEDAPADTPPAASALAGAPRATPQAQKITDDEAKELAALGLSPDQIRASRLPGHVIRRMAASAKARKDLAEATKKERENREKAGELAPVEEFKLFHRQQVSMVQAQFAAFAGRVTPLIVDQEYDDIYAILEKELHSIQVAFGAEVPTW